MKQTSGIQTNPSPKTPARERTAVKVKMTAPATPKSFRLTCQRPSNCK